MKLFDKILIANRGEIAVRIIRTARKLGIATVAVYSHHDCDSLHVTMADEAWPLGEGDLKDTYLNIGLLISIATDAHCDAIHPGYGFLSENALFASACRKAGIVFIGPSAEAIEQMGNKISARRLAEKAGLPLAVGMTGSPAELALRAEEMPYPVLIKAAAGGGGKGMRIVQSAGELPAMLEATSREAASYFGDGSVYVEQFIGNPRHIEVQIVGDRHGQVVHLYERECTIQRRYQKIVEESPSPSFTPEVRQQICDAAVSLASSINYSSVGTIEFLVDESLKFYFLEMNTRIQVEHPVTEMVTGVDLVEEQILIAAGLPMRFCQDDIKQKGHAFECRIYAEDPAAGFLPSPGMMTLFAPPHGTRVRLDTAYKGPGEVSSAFDPMIAKLIVHGADRITAGSRMVAALNDFVIQGIKTNILYLKQLFHHPEFTKNNISTAFCDLHSEAINRMVEESRNHVQMDIPLIGYLLYSLNNTGSNYDSSVWNNIGYWRLDPKIRVGAGQVVSDVEILSRRGNFCHLSFDGRNYETVVRHLEPTKLDFSVDGHTFEIRLSSDVKGYMHLTFEGHEFICYRNDILIHHDFFAATGSSAGNSGGRITPPMPGKVIRVNVVEGQVVGKGDVLVVVESMKMENSIAAPSSGTVRKVGVMAGQMVDTDKVLVELEEENS